MSYGSEAAALETTDGEMETITAFPLGWRFLLLFSVALNKAHSSAFIPFYHNNMCFIQPLSNGVFKNNFYLLFIISPKLEEINHGVVVESVTR